jgi:hypothetical protein
MIESHIIKSLQEKYSSIHPLIFQRSVERAASASELFDILSLFPNDYPVIWDEEKRRWVKTMDITQLAKFNLDVMKEK